MLLFARPALESKNIDDKKGIMLQIYNKKSVMDQPNFSIQGQ
jgi:hypothetical protein